MRVRLLTAASIFLIFIQAMAGANIDSAYNAKKQLVGFKLDERGLNSEERQALHFLYAYAPLCDVTDYSQDFYIANVRQTLLTREQMPWGKTIPSDIFMHFVLPLRVNNEPLDSARLVFYKQLKDRVKGLSMKDAILEVNHWCHEHVTYQPSDSRTSSPLQSVKTATGRCGEESTLTVAALRAVGIPARQVYTPRWAHTDDNHAWVEAWADGKWWFMGACEPEAVLNLGWFNAPASRALLMHTRVFGDYDGPEETVLKTSNYTEVNLVGNYAETAKIQFTIVDTQGKPVPNARVEFKIYNYAEFYTAVTKWADAAGRVSLTAGKGDMLVWASRDGQYGWTKATFGKDTALTVKIARHTALPRSIDIVPPPEHPVLPDVPAALAARNKQRLEQEDAMRNAYTATFITPDKAQAYPEEQRPYLVKSRGNHQVILDFLNKYSGQQERALKLLSTLTDKDLRDVTMQVLDDNMTARSNQLSPRVEAEPLRPYKHFFEQKFAAEATRYKANPQLLVEWIKKNIRLNPDTKALRYAQSATGVYNYRIADERSRDIFFVDVARSLDIDARKDAVTGKVQYRNSGSNSWIDVKWDKTGQAKATPQGTLVLDYTPTPLHDDLSYYIHFTISKMTGGRLVLQNYDENNCTWASTFKNGAQLDTGTYVLVTGSRMASGTVLATVREFKIEAGHTTTVPLTMRQATSDQVAVIGNFDSESRFNRVDIKSCTIASTPVSLLSCTGRGYYVLGIVGMGQEPSNHALRDIAKVEIGRPVVLLLEDEAAVRKFNASDFNLPAEGITYGVDPDHKILNALKSELKLASDQLPVFVIADTFNRIVYYKQGYTINMGEELRTILGKLK